MYGSASDGWEFLVSRERAYEWAQAAHTHHLERFDFWLHCKDGYEIGDQLNTAMSRMRFHENEIEFFKSVLVALDNEIDPPSVFDDGPIPRPALKFKLADFRRFGCLGWDLSSERE